MTMKKQYLVPQSESVLLPSKAVLLYVSEGDPNTDPADAPTRKFAPSYDHGNLV